MSRRCSTGTGSVRIRRIDRWVKIASPMGIESSATSTSDLSTYASLTLAVRAPEPEPFLAWGSLLAPLDDGPAAPAGPARAPVHPALPAGLGVPGRRLPQSCLVGVKQPVPEIDQGFQVPHVTDTAPGIDAPQEQHFRGEPCPDPGQVALVEQGLADGAVLVPAEAAHRLGGCRGVPAGTEQVRAEMAGDLV